MKTQFKVACKAEVYCNICRMKDAGRLHRISWQEKYDGVPPDPDFECPYGKEWGYETPKPRRAHPDLVALRILLPCDIRTSGGLCPVCRTCSSPPTCESIAAWKDCPEGHWVQVTVGVT